MQSNMSNYMQQQQYRQMMQPQVGSSLEAPSPPNPQQPAMYAVTRRSPSPATRPVRVPLEETD